MPQIVFSEEALPPLPVFCKEQWTYRLTYSLDLIDLCGAAQAVISKGFVFASGNIGITKEGKLLEGIQEQTVCPGFTI